VSIDREILEKFRELGTEQFSKVSKKDPKLYGKKFGQTKLIPFAYYVDPDTEPFSDPPHIKEIAKALQDVESGKLKRLIINMPPRHGKTLLASKIFVPWALGRKPGRRVIFSSYNDSKAEEETRFMRDLVESDEYRNIFPNVFVRSDARAKGAWVTTDGGIVIGAGSRGSITGRGADLALIDDPYKDYQDAISPIVSEAVWTWYRSVLRTRLSPNAAIVLIHTRWTKKDLTGRLIEQDGTIENGGQWKVLKLPAINVHGEALWPSQYSVQALREVEKSIGRQLFSALYQQDPLDVTERIFEEANFEEPPKNMRCFAYLDPALGGADYCALTIGGISNQEDDPKIYIAYGVIWRSNLDATYEYVERLCKKYQVATLYVESNQGQLAIANHLAKKLPTKRINNSDSNPIRIQNFVKVNWANMYFSQECQPEYLNQVLEYSEFAQHDDAPDSLAGLVQQLGIGNKNLKKRMDFLTRLLGGRLA
jgi:predicted phage terminase large subunit-like protein